MWHDAATRPRSRARPRSELKIRGHENEDEDDACGLEAGRLLAAQDADVVKPADAVRTRLRENPRSHRAETRPVARRPRARGTERKSVQDRTARGAVGIAQLAAAAHGNEEQRSHRYRG